MAGSMRLVLPDGRIVEGSVDEILSFLNGSRPGVIVDDGLVSGFVAWLVGQGISSRTVGDYRRVLERYVGVDIYGVVPRSGGEAKALRKFLVFLWERGLLSYEDYMRLRARFRPAKRSGQRYYAIDSDTIRLLREAAFSRSGRTGLVLRILYYGGIRGAEAVRLLKDWMPESEVLLPGGYVSRRLVCRDIFCRYYLGWVRGRKRCEWIYFPRILLEEIEQYAGDPPSYEYVRVLRSKLGFPVKMYRRYFYNVCVKATGKPDLCSFIESRSGGVSREHYMDVLRFADEIYPMVLKALNRARY